MCRLWINSRPSFGHSFLISPRRHHIAWAGYSASSTTGGVREEASKKSAIGFGVVQELSSTAAAHQRACEPFDETTLNYVACRTAIRAKSSWFHSVLWSTDFLLPVLLLSCLFSRFLQLLGVFLIFGDFFAHPFSRIFQRFSVIFAHLPSGRTCGRCGRRGGRRRIALCRVLGRSGRLL